MTELQFRVTRNDEGVGMIGGLAILIVAVGIAGQEPSQSELSCLLAGIAPQDRAVIAQSMIDNTELPGMDQLGERARECAAADIGETAGIQLIATALATVARDELRVRLSGRGIDPALVDRWFEAEPEVIRTTLNMEEATGTRMVLALIELGVPSATVESGSTLIGNYLGTRIMLERTRLGLPAN